MSKIQTHYDNLKVARDAPPEVIRAAYKSLAQKYHPDRNPNDARAAKIMGLLNLAYGVLSDPEERREHDAWIRHQERLHAEGSSANTSQAPPQPQPKPTSRPTPQPTYATPAQSPVSRNPVMWVLVTAGALALRLWPITLLLVLAFLNQFSDSKPPQGPAPYTAQAPGRSSVTSDTADAAIEAESAAAAAADAAQANTAAPSAKPAYTRPSFGPDGKPWPAEAAYLSGAPRLNTDGLSKVTVDNEQNDSDVLVKLVEISADNAHPIRTFYIPARGQFTIDGIDAGKYDVRYRDLDSGHLARSEQFELKETRVADGTQYSSMTMTLYKVANGNMQTYDLAESEF